MDQEELTKAELIEEADTIKPLFTRTEEEERDDLRHFFAQSLDFLCIAGFDGYFKRWNPAWTARLGWTMEELKARPFLDFVHPDDRDAMKIQVGKIAKGGETTIFENRCRHQDGSYHWLRWHARPARGRQRIFATARDVTRQKQQEREILEIADREKERLGRELHDGLCQTLAGIAALSSTLSRRLSAYSSPDVSAAAVEITQLLHETIKQARDLARGLAPYGLDEIGLDGALETLTLNVQQWFRVSCTLDCDHAFPKLGHETGLHLFRIAQEAVNNAITHGQPDRIEISLSTKDKEGMLSIRDDGEGFPGEADTLDGIGLYTLSYRARLIGASLDIRRLDPRGTAVTCAFRLSETSEDLEYVLCP